LDFGDVGWKRGCESIVEGEWVVEE
jgi:hypothetical protein